MVADERDDYEEKGADRLFWQVGEVMRGFHKAFIIP